MINYCCYYYYLNTTTPQNIFSLTLLRLKYLSLDYDILIIFSRNVNGTRMQAARSMVRRFDGRKKANYLESSRSSWVERAAAWASVNLPATIRRNITALCKQTTRRNVPRARCVNPEHWTTTSPGHGVVLVVIVILRIQVG